MLKSELIHEIERLNQHRRERYEKIQTLERDLKDAQQSYKTARKDSQESFGALANVRMVIEAMIVTKYPGGSFFPPSSMMPGDVVDQPQANDPEELCLLRHLYSLAS